MHPTMPTKCAGTRASGRAYTVHTKHSRRWLCVAQPVHQLRRPTSRDRLGGTGAAASCPELYARHPIAGVGDRHAATCHVLLREGPYCPHIVQSTRGVRYQGCSAVCRSTRCCSVSKTASPATMECREAPLGASECSCSCFPRDVCPHVLSAWRARCPGGVRELSRGVSSGARAALTRVSILTLAVFSRHTCRHTYHSFSTIITVVLCSWSSVELSSLKHVNNLRAWCARRAQRSSAQTQTFPPRAPKGTGG